MKKQTLTKKQRAMIDALGKSLGIVKTACAAAGVGRRTHYDWMKSNSDYAAAVEEARDDAGDFVETQLLKNIKAGDTTAIIFYCKTKLKGRGYTEKNETQHTGNVNITCSFQE